MNFLDALYQPADHKLCMNVAPSVAHNKIRSIVEELEKHILSVANGTVLIRLPGQQPGLLEVVLEKK